MKKRNLERIGNFLAGRGFYIVLFLCVAAIGISGYLLFATPSEGGTSLRNPDQDAAVANPTEIVIPSAPATKGDSKSNQATVSPSPTANPKASDSKTSAELNQSFVWPVSGDVVTAFSADKLVYNATLKDWRTHEGLDLAAKVGTKVLAAASGTVDQVYQDDLMGTTVVINHANNLVSIYCNLAKLPTVAVGDKVMAGDVIGAVGNTAVAESGIASHLHFEMKENGKTVDPNKILPDR